MDSDIKVELIYKLLAQGELSNDYKQNPNLEEAILERMPLAQGVFGLLTLELNGILTSRDYFIVLSHDTGENYHHVWKTDKEIQESRIEEIIDQLDHHYRTLSEDKNKPYISPYYFKIEPETEQNTSIPNNLFN
jgi:hypothetical protein